LECGVAELHVELDGLAHLADVEGVGAHLVDDHGVVLQECMTGRTFLAERRSPVSARSKGVPRKRNEGASSKSPTRPRRSSSLRRMRSGVPQTAASMNAETIPSMPISRAIAIFCA